MFSMCMCKDKQQNQIKYDIPLRYKQKSKTSGRGWYVAFIEMCKDEQNKQMFKTGERCRVWQLDAVCGLLIGLVFGRLSSLSDLIVSISIALLV